ncbi:hypothetical protein PHLGIDRAFT_108679 [Phlebiopsis gigantea 11061_1 CR5-6]|uniref:Uncharacterized protein n=1 Tax=Phlebiopsis gigantea (strain 11061_1 CR5-6) TaxID=745531 RepID=A0A0C3S864_PHLG1|nr:hypothetical protein PHLGIDRAFT_108679 [Phlebiopsis gigantea 11061_1 CR5-6]
MKRSVRISSADKKAKESAVILRSLIVGPTGITLANVKAKPISKPKVEKVKSQLLKPKTANRVIAQLRTLPASAEPLSRPDGDSAHRPAAPIHAVCLRFTDAEAETRHFSKLHAASQDNTADLGISITSAPVGAASVYSASVAQLRVVFDEMDLVNLVTAPNMGLGAPADAPGILSGSVPTAQTIIEGVEEITPQLMALGYATGKAILPDHSGMNPPVDRMSVLTYWWGFEVCMPPSTLEYLSNVPSIAHAVINVLTAMSVLNEGVREILPFVRYISSFIDTEFNMIKRADHGKGVVCAATWLVPAALVPRPWDFAPAPAAPVYSTLAENVVKSSEPAASDEPTTSPLAPSVELPSSRPASPSTLLPPIAIHATSFDEPQVNNSPPVDDTSVEVERNIEASEGDKLPIVAVVPPTPTSVNTTSSAETVAAA